MTEASVPADAGAAASADPADEQAHPRSSTPLWLAVVIAVLQKRAGLSLAGADVFVNVAGGIRLEEPAADLGLALALASSFKDRPVSPDCVAVGEVGLGGELRPVPQLARRIAEARRLGFRSAIVPKRALEEMPGSDAAFKIRPAATLAEAISIAIGE